MGNGKEGAQGEGRRLCVATKYVATKLVGATLYSSPSGNHNRSVPVQCSTIVNSGLKSVTSCAENQKSIVQFHLFEYEMSRGLQVLSEC